MSLGRARVYAGAHLRYVDDLVLLHPDAETLCRWRAAIAAFLAERLKLRLREPEATPERVKRGIDFVGWTTFWNHRRPRGRTLAACETRLGRFRRRRLRPIWNGTAWKLDTERQPEALPALRATLASYSGHLRHGAANRRWTALWRRHEWLAALFVREAHDAWRIQARWPERVLPGPVFSRARRTGARHLRAQRQRARALSVRARLARGLRR